ncbi:MAG TPA: hypothetical protein VFL54_03810 [Gammaproteobacteria bacterium]|nr:hypothetical protein [Gammaproteobacteria bacterium]
MSEHPIIAEFGAFVRRPKPLATGVKAQLFAENGPDADAVMGLGRTFYQDALVAVELDFDDQPGAGFDAYIRRPEPTVSGMVAVFFGENGEAADMMTALGLSRYLDRRAHVRVRLVQDADGRDVGKKKQKGPHSADAQALWRSSFFRSERVWQAIGTDAEFLDWLKTQPCCVSTKEYGPHDGDIVPAHVRRIANGAGTGHKPEFSAVALCDKHHSRAQHHKGESAVGGKEFFDTQRLRHLQRWAWDKLVSDLGFTSMTHVPPLAVARWAASKGLESYLPLEYSLAAFERVG